MSEQMIANLEKMIGGPRDSALLHFSLGNEYLKLGDLAKASASFQEAVSRDPKYSAAWKLLAKTLNESGDRLGALKAYQDGIAVAEAKGDLQAAKEMGVFAKRLRKALGEEAS